MSKRLTIGKVKSMYLQNVFTLPRDEEFYSNGNFYHYAIMRPGKERRVSFSSLVKSLAKKDSAAKVTLDDGTEIILLTQSDLTTSLGK